MRQHTNITRESIIRTGFLFILILAGTLNGFSQSPEELAGNYMEKYLDYTIDPEITAQILMADGQKIIAAFSPFLTDSLTRSRMEAYQMISKVGAASENEQVRSLAVKILVKGLSDNDGGIAGAVINYLREFKPVDFNAEQRYTLSIKVKESPLPPHFGKLVLLTGYVGIDELIYNYHKMLADTGTYGKKEKWDIKLALARMGDSNALDEVTRRIANLRVNDDVAYDIYPNLAYVRQKPAFDILLEAIMSDEKNCISSNPDNEARIICAFRILGYTAPYIEGFPLKTDKYGEPVIDDYDTTLALVREWITENRENYKLIQDIY